MSKERLDLLLVELGLADSRSKAQSIIMAGLALVDGQPVTKAGSLVKRDADIQLKGKTHPWVSRGGMKLDHAIRHFSPKIQGAVVADIGASTGGFTDVLLHHGAGKIYAVDVGYGQLDARLRADPRVVVMEKTNARQLTHDHIPEPLDGIVCDASFISLRTVLPATLALAGKNAWLVALIKPQFEAGRKDVGKGGVVRDQAVHQRVCDDVCHWFAASYPAWQQHPIIPSPITGPAGNVEFLFFAQV